MKLIGALLLAMTTAAWAGGGDGDVGNGTSFCSRKGEIPVPCDLYYAQREFKLPYDPAQELTLGNFGVDVQLEFKRIVDFFKNRGVPNAFDDDVRIFDTGEFLGSDRHSVEDGVSEDRQVAYAYVFRKVSTEDTSKIETVRIIEIDRAFLRSQPARIQALVLAHEYLHFVPGLDHFVISPLMKTLARCLDLQERQSRGDRQPLSEAELKDSRDLQGYFVHLNGPREYRIHPNGGGLVLSGTASGEPLDASNFIGIDSTKFLRPGEEYHLRDQVMLGGNVTKDGLGFPTEWKYGDRWSWEAGARLSRSEDITNADLVLRAAGTVSRRCKTFGIDGRCAHDVAALPIELEARVGQTTRLERLTAWVVELGKTESGKGSPYDATSYQRCYLRLGGADVEQHDRGTLLLLKLGQFGCDKLDQFKNGVVNEVRLSLNVSTAAIGLFDVGYFIAKDGSAQSGVASGGSLGLGTANIIMEVSFLDRFFAWANGSVDFRAAGTSTKSEEDTVAMNQRFSAGGGLGFKLSNGLRLKAGYEWVRDSYRFRNDALKPYEPEVSERDERGFFLTLGGRHDFLGKVHR